MADYINNVAAADAYTADLTVGPDFAAKAAVITVANNPVLMQFAVGAPGSWRWTDEREFYSIPQSFRVGQIIGVKFRNANAGQVARVLAVLSGADDPDFESGIPFSAVLSASGQVTNTGVVNRGSAQITWPGGSSLSNGVNINHGLTNVPASVVCCLASIISGIAVIVAFQVPTTDLTKFQVFAQTLDGSQPVAGSSVSFYWMAAV